MVMKAAPSAALMLALATTALADQRIATAPEVCQSLAEPYDLAEQEQVEKLNEAKAYRKLMGESKERSLARARQQQLDAGALAALEQAWNNTIASADGAIEETRAALQTLLANRQLYQGCEIAR